MTITFSLASVLLAHQSLPGANPTGAAVPVKVALA